MTKRFLPFVVLIAALLAFAACEGNSIADPTPTPSATPALTQTPASEIPKWLTDLIQRLEKEPVTNPPASITEYEYKGQAVYFLPQRCCDIFSNLYDADGNIIGHPDGGITGEGDGRVPDFFDKRRDERPIWKDLRTYDPSLVQSLAPIESAKVMSMRTIPPEYSLIVVSGLPNSCVSFGGYTIAREGSSINVDVINWEPADYSGLGCAEIYRTVESVIPLGSQFESGTTYEVEVNDTIVTFKPG